MGKMRHYGVPGGDVPDVGPDEIDGTAGDEQATREHERDRKRVGKLAIGTRISFTRPGDEGERTGAIAEIPTEYSYRVLVDDGHGDHHLEPGLVAVLWASHDVAVIGHGGNASAPRSLETRRTLRPPPVGPAQEAHRRAWVAKVDAYVAKGSPLPDAIRKANTAMECEHAMLSYQEWREAAKEPEAEKKPQSTTESVAGSKAKKETGTMSRKKRGAAWKFRDLSADDRRRIVEAVHQMVDHQGMTIADALTQAGKTLGNAISYGTYCTWRQECGLTPRTPADELVGRRGRANGQNATKLKTRNRAWLERVIAGIDDDGLTMDGAIAAANEALGMTLKRARYCALKREFGLAPKTDVHELRRRTRATKARTTEKDAGTETPEPNPPQADACPASGEGAGESAPAPVDSTVIPDVPYGIGNVATQARRLEAAVTARLRAGESGYDVAAMIHTEAEAAGVTRGDVIAQAGHLVGAWQRGAAYAQVHGRREQAVASGGVQAWLREISSLTGRLADLLGMCTQAEASATNGEDSAA